MSTEDAARPGLVGQHPTAGQRAARAAGGVATELATGLAVALLQFAVLGLILGLAVILLVLVNPYVGFAVGAVGFVAWSLKTGWIFW